MKNRTTWHTTNPNSRRTNRIKSEQNRACFNHYRLQYTTNMPPSPPPNNNIHHDGLHPPRFPGGTEGKRPHKASLLYVLYRVRIPITYIPVTGTIYIQYYLGTLAEGLGGRPAGRPGTGRGPPAGGFGGSPPPRFFFKKATFKTHFLHSSQRS